MAGLEGPPTRVEWVKFVQRVMDKPESVAHRITLVIQAH